MNVRLSVLFGGALFSCVSLLNAEDWPQWLGPNRDSVWKETGIIEKFPDSGPPVVWRAPVGPGYSGPSVANGRVYTMDRQRVTAEDGPSDPFQRRSESSSERVLCLDERDGKPVWQHTYECRYTISYPAGPRVAPLVSENRVYTLGAEGNLCCLDRETGKPLWTRDFKKDFQIKAPMWGFAGHPLMDGSRLICLVGGAGTTVVAFDKDTGKELWRALSAAEPGYSSPIIIDSGGKRQLIIFHPESANSLDPQTGEVYWSVPFKSNTGLSVATPRRLGDLLFFTSFYNGSLVVRLDQEKPAASPVWQTAKANEVQTTHLNAILGTPFLQDGHVYGACSYGQLRCLKLETGERIWESLQPTTSGAPTRWANAFIVKNGGRFFLFNEKGDLIIAKLTPEAYQEVSRAHILEPTNKDCGRLVVWSHPAFANRRCHVRNDRELVCVDLAEKR